MSEVKVREFWIDPNKIDHDCDVYDAFQIHPRQGPLQWQESLIHVIEYSYATRLEEENKKLREALKKAAQTIKDNCCEGVYLDCDCWVCEYAINLKALSGETKEGV